MVEKCCDYRSGMFLPLFCLFAKQGLKGAQQGNWPSICCAELWVFSARYTRNNQHFIRRSQFDLHFKYALVCLRSYSLKFPTSLTSSTEKTKQSQKTPSLCITRNTLKDHVEPTGSEFYSHLFHGVYLSYRT